MLHILNFFKKLCNFFLKFDILSFCLFFFFLYIYIFSNLLSQENNNLVTSLDYFICQ